MRIASHQRALEDGPVIVGIMGGSGSGKTWLAARLVERLGAGRAAMICQDSFYRDLSHLPLSARSEVNFDHPEALDWAAFRKCLIHSASARAAAVPIYDFNSHCREAGEAVIDPRPIVIFEGLWLLHRAPLRRFFHFTVFLEASGELCLQRRIERDCSERGRVAAEVDAWFQSRVLPMQRRYVEPQRRLADRVIRAPATKSDVNEIARRILELSAKSL